MDFCEVEGVEREIEKRGANWQTLVVLQNETISRRSFSGNFPKHLLTKFTVLDFAFAVETSNALH
jgi:hypothetical protein